MSIPKSLLYNLTLILSSLFSPMFTASSVNETVSKHDASVGVNSILLNVINFPSSFSSSIDIDSEELSAQRSDSDDFFDVALTIIS